MHIAMLTSGVVPVVGLPYPPGESINTSPLSLFSRGIPIFSHRKFITVDVFLTCFLIMSLVSATTATPPVTVVCSSASLWLYNASHLCGLNNTGLVICVSFTTVDTEGHNEGVLLASPLCHSSNNLSPRCFSGICQLCHGSFSVEPSTKLLYCM